MKLHEIKNDLSQEGKSIVKKITKVLSKWSNLESNYKANGLLRFSQPLPMPVESHKFTDEDVKRFQKRENFKRVQTPEQLAKVINGINNSAIKQMKNDIQKVNSIIKPYGSKVDVYEENDRWTIQIDIGKLLQFVGESTDELSESDLTDLVSKIIPKAVLDWVKHKLHKDKYIQALKLQQDIMKDRKVSAQQALVKAASTVGLNPRELQKVIDNTTHA